MAANPQKLKKVKEFGRRDILMSMALVPDSPRLLAGSFDFNVYEFDFEAEKPEQPKRELKGHRSYVTGVALTESHIVTASYDRHMIWWDRESGEQTKRVRAHDKWLRGVEVSPDGKTLASVADDMVARLWDAKTGKPLHELRDHKPMTPHHYPSMLFCCAFSPDGNVLATGDKVGQVCLWDVKTGKLIKTVESPKCYTWDPRQRRHSIGGIRSLAFSPDGKTLAVGGMDQVGNIDHLGGKARFELFDWQNGKSVHDYQADKFKGLVEHMAFSPDGKWLALGGGDNGGLLIFFDLETKKEIKTEKAPMHIHEFAFSADHETLYAVGHNKIALYELKD